MGYFKPKYHKYLSQTVEVNKPGESRKAAVHRLSSVIATAKHKLKGRQFLDDVDHYDDDSMDTANEYHDEAHHAHGGKPAKVPLHAIMRFAASGHDATASGAPRRSSPEWMREGAVADPHPAHKHLAKMGYTLNTNESTPTKHVYDHPSPGTHGHGRRIQALMTKYGGHNPEDGGFYEDKSPKSKDPIGKWDGYASFRYASEGLSHGEDSHSHSQLSPDKATGGHRLTINTGRHDN